MLLLELIDLHLKVDTFVLSMNSSLLDKGKHEKVPRDIRGEKSGKIMVISKKKTGHSNWSICNSQKGGIQVYGRVNVTCWHDTPVSNAP